jgi:hypothetical protein
MSSPTSAANNPSDLTPQNSALQNSTTTSLSAPAASTTNMHSIGGVATVNVDAPAKTPPSNLQPSCPPVKANNLLPSSVKLISPPSYAQVLARRSSRRNNTDISSTDISSEAELIVSPFITSLPTRLDSRYGQASFYVAIRKPSQHDETNISRSKLTLDASDSLHRELCALLVRLAPHSILSRATELGLLCALDPYFLDENTSKSILACIFCLTFVWPYETISRDAVQDAINLICSHNCDSPCECVISYRSNTNDGDSSLLQLKSRLAFQQSPTDLFPFAQRPPAATLNLSVSFSWSCPQHVIDLKLQMIAKRIWKQILPTAQIDQIFTRAYASADPDRPIGRISNTFHARFGLPRLEDPEARLLFTELCTLHYEFKQKQLDKDPDRNLRISSLSFSFIADKGPKRRYSAPSWFDEAHRSLQSLRPDLFTQQPLSSDSDQLQGQRLLQIQEQQPQEQHQQQIQQHQQQHQQLQQPCLHDHLSQQQQQQHELEHQHPQQQHQSPSLHDSNHHDSLAPSIDATPQPLFTSSYKILLASDGDLSLLVTFSFLLEDYGQYITSDNDPQPAGNACMLLCLAAALELSPTLLLQYFNARCNMLQADLKLYAKDPDLQHDWELFCSERPHLLSSFPAPDLDSISPGWAGWWKLGRIFDVAHLNLLAPLDIRTTPILIIRDESARNELVLSLEASGNHIIYFPPVQQTTSQPVFLRLRGGHFTLLRPVNTSCNFLDAILPSLPTPCFFHHIATDATTLPPIARLIGISGPIGSLENITAAHDLSHLNMIYSSSRTFSQSMACTSTHKHNNNPQIVDLVTPTLCSVTSPRRTPPRRSPSPNHLSSPRKAPSLGGSPPRTTLGRTPRSSISGHSTPQSPSSPSRDNNLAQSDLSSSQSSAINSETDLGALVTKTCGRNDNRFAARIGVRGYASSDETSISGSLYPSSQSASTSQTPSIFSTGSFHPTPIPSSADRPLCKCRRPMQFGQFTQDNHQCDSTDCASHIPADSFGWHCEFCSFDFCISCQTPNFSFGQDLSQSTLDDSLSTMHLASLPSSPHSTTDAPSRQEGSYAAAGGRGHHA